MRGHVDRQQAMFVMLNLEAKVPSDHPLRPIKAWCDQVFVAMRRDFEAAYSPIGRPGIPPEQLLKALLLQALYAIPSEARLMEAIDFNLLYRWFLDLAADAEVWTPETFSMNRERFLAHDLVRTFFDRVVHEALVEGLVSEDHFTIDGTLIRSLASHKSLKPIDGRSRAARQAKQAAHKNDADDDSPDGGASSSRDTLVNWKGQKLSNDTHRSTTDPDALLARKGRGKPAELCHSGHVLMENRTGLCVDVRVGHATGTAEREHAREMLARVRRRHKLRPKTVGVDTGYDDGEFLDELERKHPVIPHVPIRRGRIAATDAAGQARRRARRRMQTAGYQVSQRIRKRVEQIIGWGKTVGRWARTRFLGHERIEQEALMTGAAYNLLRMSRLASPP
jgi:transposase